MANTLCVKLTTANNTIGVAEYMFSYNLANVNPPCLAQDWLMFGTEDTDRINELLANSPVTFDPIQDLDPALMAGAVGAGFFILVPVWAAAWGLKQLLRVAKTI